MIFPDEDSSGISQPRLFTIRKATIITKRYYYVTQTQWPQTSCFEITMEILLLTILWDIALQ
jgi:hypothetical protein